jgi:hypothetical protein
VGAIATMAAVFAPSAVADPPRHILLNCASLNINGGSGGTGIVTLSDHGVAKGHCSFDVFPNLPGIELPQQPLQRAVPISCADLAKALHIALQFEPRGEVILTPSGNANVNCHNVVLA